MDWEILFSVANGSALLCWLPLLLLPRSRVTRALLDVPWLPLAYAAIYAVLVVVMLVGQGEGGMGSLADLRLAFERDAVLLLAWVHYLSFDMLVGYGILRDSQRLGLHHGLVAPCLLFTFMLGPLGLLMYAGLRLATRGSLRFDS